MAVMTRDKILFEANALMCGKGYFSFSYADLSKIIGITKASIHHHFPTKDILGETVILESLQKQEQSLTAIDENNKSCVNRIRAYIDLFIESFRNSQLPLCCALSAELDNLPVNMKEKVTIYFDCQVNWLEKTLNEGVDSGEIKSEINIHQAAMMILTLCEGACIVARPVRNEDVFRQSFEQTLTLLINKQENRYELE